MSKKRLLYLSPRILGIAYILFISMFALDIFSIQGSVPPYYLFVAFLIHMIPSFILIIMLLIAWKYEKVGGVLFILFGIELVTIFHNPLPTTLILLTPPVVIGILFLLHFRSYKS